MDRNQSKGWTESDLQSLIDNQIQEDHQFYFPNCMVGGISSSDPLHFPSRSIPMANPEHLEILKQGVVEWNAWREEN